MIPKITVHHRGGDVFDVSQEPSDRCVLGGELIKEKERRFLRNLLREELICFSVRDTFQISIRTVWRPESMLKHGGARILHRKGRFAMLLHDTVGRLTTSWTWLKLAQPLYQNGVSVILVDLPGLGKSSINNVSTLDSSVWRGHEGHILCHILDELNVSKCHVVACGNSCSALIRMIKHSPHRLEREHILHNPVLDYDDVFKDCVRGPAPGAGANWREEMQASQQHELETFLIGSEVKIFSTFDQAATARTKETHDSFMMARKHVVLEKNLQVMEVTREDICEAQIGANVPVTFLFLRKELRDRYAKALQYSRTVGPSTLTSAVTRQPTMMTNPDSPSVHRIATGQDISSAGESPVTLMGMARSKSAGAMSGFAFPRGNEAFDGGRPLSRTAGQPAWYHSAFATSPEWIASQNPSMSLPERAYTSDSAKQEAMRRLCGDPHDQRVRLLSALPSRTRHNIRALAPSNQLAITDPEPATDAEERKMIEEATRKSRHTYNEEVQMRKKMAMQRKV